MVEVGSIKLAYTAKREKIVFANEETKRGISFSTTFLDLGYFKQLETQLVQNLVPLDALQGYDISNKTQLNTIYDGLIECHVIQDNIYNRFRDVIQQFNQDQIDIISNMIDDLVIGKHQIKLVAKSLDQIPKVNDKYWEVKYNILSQLLETGNWVISGFTYEPNGDFCELGHPIKKIIYIEDKNTEQYMQFGINCIGDVMNITEESRKMINTMFETYRRTVINYTFLLEQYFMNQGYNDILGHQMHILKVLKNIIAINRTTSRGMGLRQNRRMELAANRGINNVKYDTILYLLTNGIPLPQEYQEELLSYSLEDSGILTFKTICQGVLPDVNYLVQLVYRVFLGVLLPLNVTNKDSLNEFNARENNFHTLLGISMSKKKFNNIQDNFKALKDSNYGFMTDAEYFRILQSDINILQLVQSVQQFERKVANRFPVSKDMKIFTIYDRGLSQKVHVSTVLNELLGKVKSFTARCQMLMKLEATTEVYNLMIRKLNYTITQDVFSTKRYVVYTGIYDYLVKFDLNYKDADLLPKGLIPVDIADYETEYMQSLNTKLAFSDANNLPKDIQRAISGVNSPTRVSIFLRSWRTLGVRSEKDTLALPDYDDPRVQFFLDKIIGEALFKTLANSSRVQPKPEQKQALIECFKNLANSHYQEELEYKNRLTSDEYLSSVPDLLDPDVFKRYYEHLVDTSEHISPRDGILRNLVAILNGGTAHSATLYLGAATFKNLVINRDIELDKHDMRRFNFLLNKILPQQEEREFDKRRLSLKQWNYGGKEVIEYLNKYVD